MSYDTLKVEPGRERIDVIDITLEGCSNVYGVSPCGDSGLENLLTYSETFQNFEASDFGDLTIAVVNPGSYPTGATEAVKYELLATSGDFQSQSLELMPEVGKPLTASCSFLAGALDRVTMMIYDGATAKIGQFNLTAGTVIFSSTGLTASIAADGGSWWRCTVEIADVDSGAIAGTPLLNIEPYKSTAKSIGDKLYASKLQVVQSPYATDGYIKTTSAAVVAQQVIGTTKCFNSWATCQDQANYAAIDKVFTFCTPANEIPSGAIPFLESVKGDSGELDPENGLGRRGKITVNVSDAPHDDTGIDPYVDTRDYSALERGTFWPRFRARFPFYQGRKLEWYQGFMPFDRANAKKRTYVIESLNGWGRSQKVTIVAKDPLKLAEDKRAQWPIASTGVLNTAMTDSSSHAHLHVVTGSVDEYDIHDYEPFGVVLIGSEIIKYTSVVKYTGYVELHGITRSSVDQYVTKAASHSVGDAVQKCAYFYQAKVPLVFQVLLERGANVPTAYIDYPTWESEFDTWLAGMRVTRLICKPEGVTSIIKELIPQSNTWALWFDNESESIRYQVVRPLDIGELAGTITDQDHIIAGSAICKDDDDRLVNQLLVQFGQVDPTKGADIGENYTHGFVALEVGSQSPREHGQVFSKTINGRWHPAGNRVELIAMADKLLEARSAVPIKIEFEVDRKDDGAKTGQFVTLETSVIADQFGIANPTIVRIIQQDAGDDTIRYTAREELLARYFARWAPDSYAVGFSYADADATERARYMFWADSSGLLGGTDPGKRWL